MGDHRRFFVEPSTISQDTATLSGHVAHQIRNVLRLRPGDRVTLLDNSGWCYDVEIANLNQDALVGLVRGKVLVDTEPRTKITVYQGLLRTNHFEIVLQKATELGVATVVPTICQRCVVANLDDASMRKQTRWERIVTEAAEQSRRGKLPTLRPAVLLEQACEQVRGISLMPWEDEQSVSLREALRKPVSSRAVKGGNVGRGPSVHESAGQRPFSVNLFVGPEGGFSMQEVAMARSYGVTTVTLGPRVLRAETAAIVAAALVLHEVGDLER